MNGLKRICVCVCLFLSPSVFCGSFEDLPVKVVLFPFREVILSARIDGVIASYSVRVGERFRSGDCLLKLDDRHCRNELQKAEASFSEAKAASDFSSKVLEDNRKLFRQDLQSELEIRRREVDLSIAVSRMRIAAANRDEASMLLGFCSISAPFDGRVERLYTKAFESVRTGQPLLSIIEDTRLLGVMNLPSSRINRTSIGDRFTVRVKENGALVSGSVYEIAGRADHRSETFEVKILIDNSDRRLSSGMTGSLTSTLPDAKTGKESAHGK